MSARPYLVTRRWVRDRYHEWGEDHPLWQSRVRGRFPLQSEDALFSLAWLEQAAGRKAARIAGQPVQVGLDVAGPGEDETVLTVCQAGSILLTDLESRNGVFVRSQPRQELVNGDEIVIGRTHLVVDIDPAR